MTTTDQKTNGARGELRLQTILMSVTMLLIAWGFNTTIDNGKTLVRLEQQLSNMDAERSRQLKEINDLGLDNRSLRGSLEGLDWRVKFIENANAKH